MGLLLVFQIWFPDWLIQRAWIITDQFCWIRFHFNLTGRGWKEEKMARGVVGGDYSRRAFILNISTKDGRLKGLCHGYCACLHLTDANDVNKAMFICCWAGLLLGLLGWTLFKEWSMRNACDTAPLIKGRLFEEIRYFCCVGSVSSAAVDYMRSNMFHTSLRWLIGKHNCLPVVDGYNIDKWI